MSVSSIRTYPTEYHPASPAACSLQPAGGLGHAQSRVIQPGKPESADDDSKSLYSVLRMYFVPGLPANLYFG